MKNGMRAFWLVLLLTLPLASQAQPNKEENKERPHLERIRAARAAYITERLNLTSSEAEKFWPIYNEYAGKRDELRKNLFKNRRQDDANAQALLDMDLKIRQQELDLEKEYTGKFQKVIGTEKVLKLREAERDFQKVVLRHVRDRRGPHHDKAPDRLRRYNR